MLQDWFAGFVSALSGADGEKKSGIDDVMGTDAMACPMPEMNQN